MISSCPTLVVLEARDTMGCIIWRPFTDQHDPLAWPLSEHGRIDAETVDLDLQIARLCTSIRSGRSISDERPD